MDLYSSKVNKAKPQTDLLYVLIFAASKLMMAFAASCTLVKMLKALMGVMGGCVDVQLGFGGKSLLCCVANRLTQQDGV